MSKAYKLPFARAFAYASAAGLAVCQLRGGSEPLQFPNLLSQTPPESALEASLDSGSHHGLHYGGLSSFSVGEPIASQPSPFLGAEALQVVVRSSRGRTTAGTPTAKKITKNPGMQKKKQSIQRPSQQKRSIQKPIQKPSKPVQTKQTAVARKNQRNQLGTQQANQRSTRKIRNPQQGKSKIANASKRIKKSALPANAKTSVASVATVPGLILRPKRLAAALVRVAKKPAPKPVKAAVNAGKKSVNVQSVQTVNPKPVNPKSVKSPKVPAPGTTKKAVKAAPKPTKGEEELEANEEILPFSQKSLDGKFRWVRDSFTGEVLPKSFPKCAGGDQVEKKTDQAKAEPLQLESGPTTLFHTPWYSSSPAYASRWPKALAKYWDEQRAFFMLSTSVVHEHFATVGDKSFQITVPLPGKESSSDEKTENLSVGIVFDTRLQGNGLARPLTCATDDINACDLENANNDSTQKSSEKKPAENNDSTSAERKIENLFKNSKSSTQACSKECRDGDAFACQECRKPNLPQIFVHTAVPENMASGFSKEGEAKDVNEGLSACEGSTNWEKECKYVAKADDDEKAVCDQSYEEYLKSKGEVVKTKFVSQEMLRSGKCFLKNAEKEEEFVCKPAYEKSRDSRPLPSLAKQGKHGKQTNKKNQSKQVSTSTCGSNGSKQIRKPVSCASGLELRNSSHSEVLVSANVRTIAAIAIVMDTRHQDKEEIQKRSEYQGKVVAELSKQMDEELTIEREKLEKERLAKLNNVKNSVGRPAEVSDSKSSNKDSKSSHDDDSEDSDADSMKVPDTEKMDEKTPARAARLLREEIAGLLSELTGRSKEEEMLPIVVVAPNVEEAGEKEEEEREGEKEGEKEGEEQGGDEKEADNEATEKFKPAYTIRHLG